MDIDFKTHVDNFLTSNSASVKTFLESANLNESKSFYYKHVVALLELKFKKIDSINISLDILLKPASNTNQISNIWIFKESIVALRNTLKDFYLQLKSLSINGFGRNQILTNLKILLDEESIGIVRLINIRVRNAYISTESDLILGDGFYQEFFARDVKHLILQNPHFEESKTQKKKHSIYTKKGSNAKIRGLKGELELKGYFDFVSVGHSYNCSIYYTTLDTKLATFQDCEISLLELKKFSDYKKCLLTFNRTSVENLSLIRTCFKSKVEIEIFDDHFNPNISTNEVNWSYDGIKEFELYSEGKRRLINNLKNHYTEKQDIFNSQLMNAFEKRWYLENNRFNFPLVLSWHSNSFGLSLGKPLMWIFFFILLQTYILLSLSGNCELLLAENWGIFFNIINPAHKTSIFLDVFNDYCEPPLAYKNLLYVVDNIVRIFIGYLIFQFANAFRYKYRLR